MHGRTRLLILALAVACLVPSTAAAAPMPAGTYDVKLGDGTIDLGSGFLPPITLNSGTSFTVPIGTQPIAQPIGLTILDAPISGSGITGSVPVTILGAGITIDPTDGSASIDASFYATLNLSYNFGLGTVSTSCPIGTAGNPVTVHLTTAKGSAWDPSSGAFSLVDNTFSLPTITCSNALFNALLGTILGTTTNPGDNLVSLVGTALRQVETVTNNNITTNNNTSTTTPGGTTSPEAPAAVAPTVVPKPVATKSCVVPKLVGKTYKQAKRALKKAGCKVGKKKSKKSKKKKGRIVKQSYKAGTKLPAGTKVPITVSRGVKKRHKR